ncbi:outer membrane protein assembly factor BamE [Catenovulum sediminis]|uniref:Outer membrane protein assembly factor BamE n=1 Tax=Catenovulum sediminis TaxID=1740262 RepID=A0ABV1RKX9_9ALTE
MSNKIYKSIRIITWVIGGLSLAVFYVWFEYLRPAPGQLVQQQTFAFNPLVWSKGAGDYSMANPRQTMYLDLLQNHLQNGMSRTETERLLGQPEHFTAQENYYLLSYDLNRSDYQYLVVRFDNTKNIIMYYRYESAYALTN